MADHRLLICPYCGETQPESDRCRACSGLFEPLSRQATHNAMGPWFIRDDQRPHQPGCSYETLVKLIQRGRVTRYTIMRGPTTRQFWTIAKRVPGISHYFGACYQCDASVDPDDRACHACGATFGGFLDRNFLGLPEYRPLPWEGDEAVPRRPDVEPGEPSDWRQQMSEPASGPRGISSFATDEELLGDPAAKPDHSAPAASHGGGASAPTPEPPRPAPTASSSAGQSALAATTVGPATEPAGEPNTVSSPHPDPRSGAEPVAGEITHRALERKLVRQHRAIRTLGAAVVGIAALAAVFALLWLETRGATNSMPADTERDEAETPRVDRETADPTMPRIDHEEPIDEPPAAQADVFSEAHEAAYREARHLVDRASDPEAELADRIADLERAIDAFDQLSRSVAAPALPEDFAETRQEARRMLERLRLREFFP